MDSNNASNPSNPGTSDRLSVEDMEIIFAPSGYPEESTGDLQIGGDDEDSDGDAGPSTSTDAPIVLSRQQEKELTNKFLNGELSFSEYAAFMEGTEEDEDGEVAPVNEPLVAAKFEEELQAARTIGKKNKDSGSGVPVKRRKRRHLPQALQGLMGEANLRYARGEKDMAVKMCLEIIRQVPTAPEPFQTLAGLYEELGQYEKSLQFSLIAAHLNPQNAEQWIRLACMSEESDNKKQALTCYSKAIKADPKNIDLYMKRGRLLEEIGDRRLALKSYMRLLNILTPEQGPMILEMSKMLAMKYHCDMELGKACDAMEVAFTKVPDLISSEEVNMLLELLIHLKKFSRCLEVLVQFCNIEIEVDSTNNPDLSEEPTLTVITCSIPDQLAVDLHAKVTVVLIHLKAFHLTNDFISLLLSKASPEDAGDLYLDVAEALIAEDQHPDALCLTSPLVNCVKYSLPAVWLRHAECLKASNRLSESAAAYEVVISQAPQHLDTRMTLSGLYSQLGCHDRALAILAQDPTEDVLDAGLLYERCMLLKDDKNRVDDYIGAGQLLLSRHCVDIRNREELMVLSRLHRIDKKKSALVEIRRARGEPEADESAAVFEDGKNVPSVIEEWNLLYDLCKLCVDCGRFCMAQRLSFSALGSQRFSADVAMRRETEFLALCTSILNGDTIMGYNLIRVIVLRRETKRIWNIFNQVIQRADHVRHNRFFIRLMMRHLDHEGLLILHANSCLVAGTYKYALTDYVNAFRVNPNPMVALLIGITLFQIACQKFSARKNSLVVQGLAFFGQYKQMRGPEGQQEVNYNLGRAFHQLGLISPAIHHYEKALEFESKLNAQHSAILDLKQETAFNLHLIYKNSGNRDMARYYIDKYITI